MMFSCVYSAIAIMSLTWLFNYIINEMKWSKAGSYVKNQQWLLFFLDTVYILLHDKTPVTATHYYETHSAHNWLSGKIAAHFDLLYKQQESLLMVTLLQWVSVLIVHLDLTTATQSTSANLEFSLCCSCFFCSSFNSIISSVPSLYIELRHAN